MSEPRIDRLSAHMSGYQGGINRIVWHDEEYPEKSTSAEDIASYFAGQGAGGSAHYVTDNNSEMHCVPDNRVAWHAPPNTGSIGIEQSGYARQSRAEWLDAYSRDNIARTAARTAELCVRFNVPVVWLSATDVKNGARGITSHNNVSLAFHQSDHNDPGPAFPADLAIPLTREGVTQLSGTAAIKAFQAAHGLVTDGDPGRLTVLALGAYLRPVLDKLASGKPTPGPAPIPGNRFANEPNVRYGDGLVGAASSAVRDAQHALNQVGGASLGEDGRFGKATDTAVRNFQRFFKGAVDGIVGPITWAMFDFLLDLSHL